MKVALFILGIAFILGLTMIVDLTDSRNQGAIISEIGQIRLDRLIEARTGLPYTQEGNCLMLTRDSDQLLRLNSDQAHYEFYGINQIELFFEKEKQLFSVLDVISNNTKCTAKIQDRAKQLKSQLINIDARLISLTIENSKCNNLGLAKEQLKQALLINSTITPINALEQSAYLARYCRAPAFKDYAMVAAPAAVIQT